MGRFAWLVPQITVLAAVVSACVCGACVGLIGSQWLIGTFETWSVFSGWAGVIVIPSFILALLFAYLRPQAVVWSDKQARLAGLRADDAETLLMIENNSRKNAKEQAERQKALQDSSRTLDLELAKTRREADLAAAKLDEQRIKNETAAAFERARRLRETAAKDLEDSRRDNY
ncbi:hypothetical protein [Methylobacterium sp. B1]|uniref:hypothetical protein n=1 Tax=Methylobacterium sp. B1 TaxID=91459 RepID=UPI0011D26842|nr:hypothetical protein [Methylobacterium sp. B1]